MSIFLDPTGRSTYGIGICARCSRKFSLEDLYSDPNSPGLKVCLDDMDQYDPYRLPPREPDKIDLPFYRPDVPLSAGGPIPNDIALFGVRATEGGNLRVTAGGQLRVLESATVIRDW
jgi:hypothetical protein